MAAVKVHNARTRSSRLHKGSQHNEKLNKDNLMLLRRYGASLLLRQRCQNTDGLDRSHGCMPSALLRKDLRDGGRRTPNAFVALMFIHLNPSEIFEPGDPQPTITPRRVLLDTGADFNLISHGAVTELSLTKQPYEGRVHSIGGSATFNGTLPLQWHFRSPLSTSSCSLLLHRAPFNVLAAGEEAMFDCIIGRQWIDENWTEFIALVEMNRQRATLA
ncbi:hypothetical protein A1O1_04884, partial [Capronia coronata CBS 617.96]